MAFSQNNIVHGAAQMIVDGTNVGYTSGGVTLRRSLEYLDVEADQAAGVIAKKVTMEKMFISTTLLESTVANMLMALNADSAGSGDGSFGLPSPETNEHTLSIIGKAPSGGTRTYTFYRAVISEDVEHSVGSREAVNELPVTFELLKDPAHGTTFGSFADTP